MKKKRKNKSQESIYNIPDSDGNCPVGTRPVIFVDSVTGARKTVCVPDETRIEDIVPDENDNCPEGYRLVIFQNPTTGERIKKCVKIGT